MTKEEYEIETSKAIMEMRNHIEELKKEIEKLKEKLKDTEKSRDYWKGSSFDWRHKCKSRKHFKVAKKAEEYANKNVPIDAFGYRSLDDVHYYVKQAYLAVLKAGKDMAEADLATVAYMQGDERYKTKWHKLADCDYPPHGKGGCTINVLTDCGDIAYYNYDEECWVAEPSSAEIDPPVAWCKIPTFTDKE